MFEDLRTIFGAGNCRGTSNRVGQILNVFQCRTGRTMVRSLKEWTKADHIRRMSEAKKSRSSFHILWEAPCSQISRLPGAENLYGLIFLFILVA